MWDNVKTYNILDSFNKLASELKIETRFLISLLIMEGYLRIDTGDYGLEFVKEYNKAYFLTTTDDEGYHKIGITELGKEMIRSLMQNKKDYDYNAIYAKNSMSDFELIANKLDIHWKFILQLLFDNGYLDVDATNRLIVKEKGIKYFENKDTDFYVTYRSFLTIEELVKTTREN